MKLQTGKQKQLGQGMTEYIIIVALIAASAIGVYTFFGRTVQHQTASLAQSLAGQTSKATSENISAIGAAGEATANAAKNSSLATYGAQGAGQ
ncbi:pilus assembly protein [Trinickia mobilis]|uniref:pilus assembly protein n=1 Tax=Trinickia mobilis TaxID=2816356 RepID=UPI001A8C5023|nr:pilus assembly protein [Trinickia mobilis]